MKTRNLLFAAFVAAIAIPSIESVAKVLPPSNKGVIPVDGKQYYIYNIGSGMYLSHGSSWGMHLTVDGSGRAIAVYSNNDDTYAMHHSGIDMKKYQSEDGWCDHTPAGKFIFEKTTSGDFENVFYIKGSGGDYLCWEGGVGIYGDEVTATYGSEDNDNYKWVFYPIGQRKHLKNGGDASYLIVNGDFTANIDGNYESPVLEGWETDFWGNKSKQANISGIFAERWAGKEKPDYGKQIEPKIYHLYDCYLKQTAKIPAGRYTLSVNAWATQQNLSADIKGAYLFAGDQQIEIGANGTYSIDFETDGTGIEIGVKTVDTNANWIAVDQFRLTVIEGTVGALAQNLVDGKGGEEETWYKMEIPADGNYKLFLPNGGYINYTTKAINYPSEVAATLQSGDKVKLEAGTIYLKPSKKNFISFSKK